MATFYGDKQALATSLLGKYGQSVALINSERTVLDTVKAIKGPVRVENTPASVVEQAAATIYASAGTIEPDVNHYILMNGEIWKIIYVDAVQPTDTTIIYSLFVRK